MGFIFKKSKKVGKRGRVTVSKRGVSASTGIGPVRVSSRGRGSVKLGKGKWFKF